MDVETVYGLVEKLHVLFGVSIFGNYKKLSYAIRFIIWTLALYTAILNVQHHEEVPLVQCFRSWSMIILPLVNQVLLIIKSPKIRCLLTALEDLSSDSQGKRLRKYSLIPVIVYVVVFVFLSSIDVYWYTLSPDMEEDINSFIPWQIDTLEWHHTLIVVITYTIFNSMFLRQWITLVVTIYCITLISWSLANADLMTYGISLHKMNTDQCARLIRQKRNLLRLKKTFNRDFGIFPLLIFSALFLESSGLILLLREHGIDSDNLGRISSYLTNALLVILLLKVVTYVQEQEVEYNDNLLELWWIKTSSINDSRLISAFKDTFEISHPLTAILFVLHEPILLCFTSSLIGFTVMFIQLN
ncbi:hypothetical protein HDE_03446 [Halotydeus destructor]|nr:hypothetical protein HDE_03446 [Halotydeus destructor]